MPAKPLMLQRLATAAHGHRFFATPCAKTCIELGVLIVTTGRADPGEAIVRRLKAAGITVVSVVSTVEHARRTMAPALQCRQAALRPPAPEAMLPPASDLAYAPR